MAKPKFTRRADGTKQADMRIQHNYGLPELANYVAHLISEDGPVIKSGKVILPNAAKFRSARALIADYRQQVTEASNGLADSAWLYWKQQHHETDVAAIILAAEKEVLRLLPELA